MSRGARRRLIGIIGRLSRDHSPAAVVLTWPGAAVSNGAKTSLEPAEWKRALDVFVKRLRRRYPDCSGLWVMEVKPRLSGAAKGRLMPHVHALVYGVDEEPLRELREYFNGAWNDVLGADAKHREVGVSVEMPQHPVAPLLYLASRGKVPSEQERAALVEAFPDGIGRSWGRWGKLPLAEPVEIEITEREAIRLIRCLERQVDAERRAAGDPRRLHGRARYRLGLNVQRPEDYLRLLPILRGDDADSPPHQPDSNAPYRRAA